MIPKDYIDSNQYNLFITPYLIFKYYGIPYTDNNMCYHTYFHLNEWILFGQTIPMFIQNICNGTSFKLSICIVIENKILLSAT